MEGHFVKSDQISNHKWSRLTNMAKFTLDTPAPQWTRMLPNLRPRLSAFCTVVNLFTHFLKQNWYFLFLVVQQIVLIVSDWTIIANIKSCCHCKNYHNHHEYLWWYFYVWAIRDSRLQQHPLAIRSCRYCWLESDWHASMGRCSFWCGAFK